MKRVSGLLCFAMLGLAPYLSMANDTEINSPNTFALRILKNLEVNTFNNSLRQRDFPEGTTLHQTPFHFYKKIEGFKQAYSATDETPSWIFSLYFIKTTSAGIEICFTEKNLQGSYHSAATLLVSINKHSHYQVLNQLPDDSSCTITRG